MNGSPDITTSQDFLNMREIYDRHGVVLVRGLINLDLIENFQRAFLRMMDAYMRQYGKTLKSLTDLDTAYRQFCDEEAEAALSMRGLGKDLPEYHHLLIYDRLISAVSELIGHDSFQINYDQCLFRIDRPSEDRFGFPWHQDYPYNLMSRNAVTVWIPLTSVTTNMGLLRVLPGSHTSLYPVTVDRTHENVRFEKHHTIRIENSEKLFPEFEALATDIPEVEPGDAVFIHSHLLHRSGANRSDRCRWVFNPRYGDLLDENVIRRRWSSSRSTAPFIVDKIEPQVVSR